MPLITKAARRVKKPKWQRGLKPPTKDQRDALAIVANHEAKFTRAFSALLRNLITPETIKVMRRAIATNPTVESTLADMNFFDPDDPSTFEVWEAFARRTEATYEVVIQETIDNENRKRGWDFSIAKAEAPIISVNADAVEFMRVQSLTRVVDMSNKEKERVRAILTRGFESGARPEAIIEEIEDTIGLTAHQTDRLNRKFDKAREDGMSRDNARKVRKRDAKKAILVRARAIARTETNDAMVRGLTESWKQAADGGLVPPGTKKSWVNMGDEAGSEICEDLNNHEPIGLNEDFHSSVDPGFDGPGPPAHPN